MNIKTHDARVSCLDLTDFPISHAHALLNSTASLFCASNFTRTSFSVCLLSVCVDVKGVILEQMCVFVCGWLIGFARRDARQYVCVFLWNKYIDYLLKDNLPHLPRARTHNFLPFVSARVSVWFSSSSFVYLCCVLSVTCLLKSYALDLVVCLFVLCCVSFCFSASISLHVLHDLIIIFLQLIIFHIPHLFVCVFTFCHFALRCVQSNSHIYLEGPIYDDDNDYEQMMKDEEWDA